MMRFTPIFGIIAVLGCDDHPDRGAIGPPVVSVSVSSSQALRAAATSSTAGDQLLLHVVETSVHTTSAGWSIISTDARDVDLRMLAGTVEQIATGTVASGKVNQIRLALDGATLVNADGSTREVTVPSDVLKLIIAPPIAVVSGSTTAVTLVVDGTMEHEAGDKYMLRPVVKLSPAP